MTMFITGGTSSIGRILVRELSAQGIPMRVMVRKVSHYTASTVRTISYI